MLKRLMNWLVVKIFFLFLVSILPSCHGNAHRFLNSSEGTTNYVVEHSTWMANTGVTCNPHSREMLFGVWDSQLNRSFIKITNMDLTQTIGSIMIPTDVIDCVQGISFDADHFQIYVWGYKPNTNRQIPELFVMDMHGNVLQKLPNPVVEDSPGMIAYQSPNSLWMKSNEATHARLYHLPDMNLVNDIDTKIAGEGVALSPQKESIWVHGSCTIRKINILTKAQMDIVSPNPLCSEEGLAFDGEGNLWVTDDDGYHFNQKDGNQAWKISERDLP